MKPSALVFDCDGVILESTDIKSRAFFALAEPFGPEAQRRFLQYHEQQAGVSRFTKFAWLYTTIAGREISAGESEDLGRRFTKMCREAVLAAPFVPGFQALLDSFCGRVPLFVGGTPFYYNALFHAALSDGLPSDRKTRERWERIAESEGSEALHRRLAEADAVTAERLHPHDVRRVSRALEIFELTGVPPSRLYAREAKKRSNLDVLYIGLVRPRAELYENIAERAKRQFASGYPEEVVWLMDHGFDERFTSMQGFGYRELAAWRRGALTLAEALEGDIRRTKAFCRRQMTWFGKFTPALWYDISEVGLDDLLVKVCEAAKGHLEGRNRIMKEKNERDYM
jgi:tRNA dimethylallyltransferase